MDKLTLARRISANMGTSIDMAYDFLSAFQYEVKSALIDGESIKLIGLGVLEPIHKKGRICENFGNPVYKDAWTDIKFRASKEIINVLNV